MEIPKFEVRKSENDDWMEIYRDKELYCKTRDEDTANPVIHLLKIYENALKQTIDSINKPINEKILKEFIRPMIHDMTVQIREKTSPEVRIQVRRAAREVERQIDSIKDAVEDATREELSKE